MIVFVCGNHQENENGSTFSFSKIGNTCIKIGISDLHLVKLPRIRFPQYTFSKYIQNQISSLFSRDLSVSARQNLSKNVHWITDIFSKSSNFNYFPPKITCF